tara:strand:+ start:663 stop:842 length:180 start_codon:yes stop_codon:yes gene_type:complete
MTDLEKAVSKSRELLNDEARKMLDDNCEDRDVRMMIYDIITKLDVTLAGLKLKASSLNG